MLILCMISIRHVERILRLLYNIEYQMQCYSIFVYVSLLDIVILIFNISKTLQKELYKESSVAILCLVNVENIGW